MHALFLVRWIDAANTDVVPTFQRVTHFGVPGSQLGGEGGAPRASACLRRPGSGHNPFCYAARQIENPFRRGAVFMDRREIGASAVASAGAVDKSPARSTAHGSRISPRITSRLSSCSSVDPLIFCRERAVIPAAKRRCFVERYAPCGTPWVVACEACAGFALHAGIPSGDGDFGGIDSKRRGDDHVDRVHDPLRFPVSWTDANASRADEDTTRLDDAGAVGGGVGGGAGCGGAEAAVVLKDLAEEATARAEGLKSLRAACGLGGLGAGLCGGQDDSSRGNPDGDDGGREFARGAAHQDKASMRSMGTRARWRRDSSISMRG